jgi:hypothetical protein
MKSFEERQAEWLKRTGLRVSSAGPKKVLPWLKRNKLPKGFEHNGVYYLRQHQMYFLLTEPSDSPPETALESLAVLDNERGGHFFFATGMTETGLWKPGFCTPILFAAYDIRFITGYQEYSLIDRLVLLLPSRWDQGEYAKP